MSTILNGTDQVLVLTEGTLAFSTSYCVEITFGSTHLPNGVWDGAASQNMLVSTDNWYRPGENVNGKLDFVRATGDVTHQLAAGPVWDSTTRPSPSTFNAALSGGILYKVNNLTIPTIYAANVPLITFFGSVQSTDVYQNFTAADIAQIVLKDATNTSTLATFDLSTPAASYSNSGFTLTFVGYDVADTRPPDFTSAPAVTATSGSGHTLTMTLDEDCTIYGVQLAMGATSPSAAQVKAGTDGDDGAPVSAASGSAIADTPKDITFSGGAVSTQYQYFFSAEDGAGNLQAAASNVVLAVTGAGSIAITGGTLTAGSAFAGTYTGISSISSPITLTDSQGNTLNVAITDAGGGNFSGTMPALPTSGSSSSILFGTVTVSGGE